MSQPLAILSTGLVCGVGLNAPAACAAIRCSIDNFQETAFVDHINEPIQGCSTPLADNVRGATKHSVMLNRVLHECLSNVSTPPLDEVPLIICTAEQTRPGRDPNIDQMLFKTVRYEFDTPFHESSRIIPRGRVSAAVALKLARDWIANRICQNVIIAGVDSLLNAQTLTAFESHGYILTSNNSNGFIPGEAAAAVLVGRPQRTHDAQLICCGFGFAKETATLKSNHPLRADGLTKAIQDAEKDAGLAIGELDFRLSDVSGAAYYFKETALALTRTLHTRKAEFDLWHPADCIGEVGAAIGPALLTVAKIATRKNYAPGNKILCQLGNDAGERAALILHYR